MLSKELKMVLALKIKDNKDNLGRYNVKFKQFRGKIEDINQLRSREWDYLRKATIHKFSKSLKTGAEGIQLTELDNVVLDIVDRKSINVSGIDVPDNNISFGSSDEVIPLTSSQPSTSSKEIRSIVSEQSLTAASFISSISGPRFDKTGTSHLDTYAFTESILQDSPKKKKISTGALKSLKRKQSRESLLVDGNFKKLKVSVLGLEKKKLQKEQSLRLQLLKLDVALRKQQIRKEKALTKYYTTATQLMNDKLPLSNQQHFINTEMEAILKQ
nr:uncharacterized protein LOC105850525 [Hydra vulgaris]